ncbi:MAG: hypothetical protein GXP54_04510 [Deltaproteobacteria bacterium]|nr:hypothetical protein [Deltaproteobacteria bacterium]
MNTNWALAIVATTALLSGCGSDKGIIDGKDIVQDAARDAAPEAVEKQILPTAGFLARQAEYLAVCSEHSGPGEGGIHGQVCRVATGQTMYNEEALEATFQKMANREDTSDFHLASLVRMLYLDRDKAALPDDIKQKVVNTVLGFKYWLDEPGKDKMCYWTENHQGLYHSGELLAGQLFLDKVFPNSGMTGAQHVEHATPMVVRWLDMRGRFGFSEWHSNVYFNEDMPALLNLADFAGDEEIRTKAAMVLDVMAFDMLNNCYKGLFATAHGRTYDGKLLEKLKDSTTDALWLMTGLGERSSTGNFTAAFLATSPRYVTPGILENAAAAARKNHEHRQRDGIDVADGSKWGIGYTDVDDVVIWAGMAALVAPDVIDGTMSMLDDFDLWDGFLFGDIPDEFKGLLKGMTGTPQLREFAETLEPLSRGMALESMSTYTFRTPDYQLSGAQDYKPGMWGTQTHIWQATLDRDAYVFTTYPGGFGDLDVGGLDFAGQWVGGWLPRATLYRNVAVIRYDPIPVEGLGDLIDQDHSHAFFPKGRFDDFVQQGRWVMGRKGDGYVALYSENEPHWSDDVEYELIADTHENTWIVEMGSKSGNGSFDTFVKGIKESTVDIDEKGNVSYESPSLGKVEVAAEGPMKVAGKAVDLGPYPRWDNAWAHQEFGTDVTVIQYGGETLELDFDKGTRRLFAPATPEGQ